MSYARIRGKTYAAAFGPDEPPRLLEDDHEGVDGEAPELLRPHEV